MCSRQRLGALAATPRRAQGLGLKADGGAALRAGLAENLCLSRYATGARLLQVGEQDLALGIKFQVRAGCFARSPESRSVNRNSGAWGRSRDG